MQTKFVSIIEMCKRMLLLVWTILMAFVSVSIQIRKRNIMNLLSDRNAYCLCICIYAITIKAKCIILWTLETYLHKLLSRLIPSHPQTVMLMMNAKYVRLSNWIRIIWKYEMKWPDTIKYKIINDPNDLVVFWMHLSF